MSHVIPQPTRKPIMVSVHTQDLALSYNMIIQWQLLVRPDNMTLSLHNVWLAHIQHGSVNIIYITHEAVNQCWCTQFYHHFATLAAQLCSRGQNTGYLTRGGSRIWVWVFGGKLSAKGARIEVPQAPRVYGEQDMGRGFQECPIPINFWGIEMHILVHFLARLSICFCTVILPGPDLQYTCPLWHFRLTVAQSKALEFLQKSALNIIFPDTNTWQI